MKKRITAILTMAMMLTLVACGNQDKSLDTMKLDKYVTLGEYVGIEIPVAAIEVTDAEVEDYVEYVAQAYVTAENGIKDRAAKLGDTVNIDYAGYLNGVAFDGGTAAAQSLELGSGSFIDGFEDGLVGVNPGETVDLPLTFPEGYGNAELAGQDVIFTVTVNFIYPNAEDVDDALVAAFGNENFTNRAELDKFAYDYIYSGKEYDNEMMVSDAIIETVISNATVHEMPEGLVEECEQLLTDSINQMAAMYGVDADTFLMYNYYTDLATYVSTYGEEVAKQHLVFMAIAEQEDLRISDADYDKILLEDATAAGYETVEEYLGDVDKALQKRYYILDEVLAFLTENAMLVEQ